MKTKNLLIGVSLTLIFLTPNVSFTQDTWTQKADFPGEPRYRAATFTIGTKGYISFAYGTGDYYLNDLWEWDQTTNLWTRKTDCPGKPEGFGISFSIGTKGYLGLGFTNEFWEYDPEANSWTQKASFPGESFGGTSFSIGTKGYCLNLGGLWEWDQTTNEWTKKSEYPGKTYDVSFSIGNKGYVGVGYDYGTESYINEFWEWDQESNIWTRKADFEGTSRFEAVSFSIGNKGYIGTGMRDLNTSSWTTDNELWEWDQTTNVWTKKADFGGTSRRSANSFSIGNKGYIGLGTTASTDQFYLDFWEFDPLETTSVVKSSEENIGIYPNPGKGKFTINGTSQITAIEVYNLLGDRIYTDYNLRQQTPEELYLSNAPKGIYVVKIYTGTKSLNRKVIIQ
jgi:N-acetylneuraminic acid mutarotase